MKLPFRYEIGPHPEVIWNRVNFMNLLTHNLGEGLFWSTPSCSLLVSLERLLLVRASKILWQPEKYTDPVARKGTRNKTKTKQTGRQGLPLWPNGGMSEET